MDFGYAKGLGVSLPAETVGSSALRSFRELQEFLQVLMCHHRQPIRISVPPLRKLKQQFAHRLITEDRRNCLIFEPKVS